MPSIGLGTFGSDHVTGEAVARAVVDAARLGYRHFDCASVYGNERAIGGAFRELLQTGLRREELWVTSKLWNDQHTPEDVVPACQQSLRDLGLDYLDLYLIHWPFPNFHPPGCSGDSRSANAKPYLHDAYMKTWRQLEGLVRAGLVRHIGTSNMSIPKLELLLRDAEIRPVANEMELHPHFQQPQLFRYVTEQGLVAIGFCPIGSPARPERDRSVTDSAPTSDPVILNIAERLGVHPAVVCVKWAISRGQVPIPFSTTPRNYLANLRAAVSLALTAEDMTAIAKADRACRLIKGQVFLWREGQSWEDLWDMDGSIAG